MIMEDYLIVVLYWVIIQFKIYVMINRSYLQQVAMIESQCEPRKKQPMINTYTKSPLRDRENRMNVGNTPKCIGPKSSLSPLRSRRTESSITNRSIFNRKRNQAYCINDPHKSAKYFTISEEETLYYCEKCAILLASQGFSVSKLSSNQSFESNPRKQEIDGFLSELEVVMASLGKKQNAIHSNVTNTFQTYQQQQAKVEQYYGHFYEIINQHKRRVLEELKQQFDQATKESNQGKTRLESAIVDSKRMKDDIIQSMNIILYESDQTQFRPIMDNYQMNLREYKGLTNKIAAQPINMRRLDFKEPQHACNALDEGLQIHWEEKKMMNQSKQSDCPQNPIQVIDSEQRFTKSSLREIGNLFSSFDE